MIPQEPLTNPIVIQTPPSWPCTLQCACQIPPKYRRNPGSPCPGHFPTRQHHLGSLSLLRQVPFFQQIPSPPTSRPIQLVCDLSAQPDCPGAQPRFLDAVTRRWVFIVNDFL